VAVQTVLSGLRKAAIVTLLLGEDASANVFRHLTEDEAETLAREVAALGRVPAGVSENVLEEFNQIAEAADFVAKGDIDYAGRILKKSLGESQGREIMDRVLLSFQTTAGFQTLGRTDPEQLQQAVRALGGPEVRLTLEASALTRWVVGLLRPLVGQLVICEPRHNRLIAANPGKNDQQDVAETTGPAWRDWSTLSADQLLPRRVNVASIALYL